MKYTIVDELPKSRRYNSLKHELEEFMGLNVKYAKVEYGNDYVSSSSAAGSFRRSAKRMGMPIIVYERNGDVYFTRTDI